MKNNVPPRGTEPEIDPLVEQGEKVQNEIEKNSGHFGDGFGLVIVGFPGSGKSIASERAAEKLEEKTDLEPTVVDINYCDEKYDTEYRAEALNSYTTEQLINKIDSDFGLSNSSIAILDGVKSFDELEYFAKFFEELGIIYLESHSQARHHRLIEQAREKEKDLAEFSHDKLRGRDVEASSAGLDDIEKVLFCDTKITNNDIDKEQFLKAVSYASSDLYLDYKHR